MKLEKRRDKRVEDEKKQSQKKHMGSMGNGLKAEERMSGWGWDKK